MMRYFQQKIVPKMLQLYGYSALEQRKYSFIFFGLDGASEKMKVCCGRLSGRTFLQIYFFSIYIRNLEIGPLK
jgi:hypothetical protein